jgi:organic radical activating enzyme
VKKVDLNDYVCAVPFAALEIHEKHRFLCCASWLKKGLPQNSSPRDAWESPDAQEIRESVIDGSFRHCDKVQCPYLHQLENFGEIGNTSVLYHKNRLPKDLESNIDSFKKGIVTPPSTIQFSFDRTCNLKCPSCRINLIVENSKGIERVKKTIDEIEEQYGKTTKRLYITGSGDPFVSVGFRDFLRNFDSNKWPSLSNIHLHTNATRWDKKMWESMSKVHKYIKTCEISIDAATKDTYENKVRVGGNWDELIENLKFINTIKSLKSIKTSFVVQQKNYKEMKLFYDLMYSIFGEKVNVFFGKITNWGTFSEEDFLLEQIWNESHSEYNEFIKEVNSFMPNNYSWSNLQEFITPAKTLI